MSSMVTNTTPHGTTDRDLHSPSFGSGVFIPIAGIQGLYYALTGLWPLISIESFQWFTGPKTDHLSTGREADHWLVMTVAVLILAISLPLLVGAWRRSIAPELVTLGIAAAVSLASIDVIYVSRNVIAPIYLLDALLECVILVLWLAGIFTRSAKESIGTHKTDGIAC